MRICWVLSLVLGVEVGWGTPLTPIEMKAHIQVLSAPIHMMSSQELYGTSVNGTSEPGFIKTYLDERSGVCRTENYNSFAKKPDGRMLLAACKRAKNFLKIYETFRACKVPVNFKDVVLNPILRSASQRDLAEVASKLGADCQGEKNNLSENLQNAMKLTQAGIVDRLQEISLRNAVKAYWFYSQSLPTRTRQTPEAVINALCKRPERGSNWGHCTKSSETQIRKLVGELAKVPSSPASASSVANQLNRRLRELDQAAHQVTAPAISGFFSVSPKITEENRLTYSKFASAYTQAVQDTYGVLLTTEALQKTVGRAHVSTAEKLEGDDFTKRNVGIGQFYLRLKGYSTIPAGRENLVVDATEELLSNISKETESLNKIRAANEEVREGKRSRIEFSPTRLLGKTVEEQSLHRLIRTNPVAAGELLVDAPNLATTFCLAMKDMVSDDETVDDYKKVFVAGGVVLTATGIGAGFVGAGGAALAVISGAGVAAASANAGIDWARYDQAKQGLYSYQAGNGTAQAPMKVQEAWNQAVESTQAAGMEAAGVIGGFGVAKTFHKLAAAGKFERAAEFADNVKWFATRLKDSKHSRKIAEFLEKTGLKGDRVESLLTRLMKEDPKMRDKFVDRMATATEEDFRKFKRSFDAGC